MWTKNSNGEPFNWVHPGHKVKTRDEVLGKFARETLAAELVEWLGNVLEYLSVDAWTFAVNKKGEYLPGKAQGVKPEAFRREWGACQITLLPLSTVERVPHTQGELRDARERIHEAVTVLLMNLVGSAPAGKMLGVYRAAHQLPKIRKADIIGVQAPLF